MELASSKALVVAIHAPRISPKHALALTSAGCAEDLALCISDTGVVWHFLLVPVPHSNRACALPVLEVARTLIGLLVCARFFYSEAPTLLWVADAAVGL